MTDIENKAVEEQTAPETTEETANEEKTFTQEEVNEMIKQRLGREREKAEKEYKTKLEKEKAEAEKLAAMNEQQKVAYELEQVKKENADLKASQAKYEMSKTAAAIFKENKIDATQEMLDFVVSDTAEATKANIEKLLSVIQSQVKAAEVKRATGTTPETYGEANEKDAFAKKLDKWKK